MFLQIQSNDNPCTEMGNSVPPQRNKVLTQILCIIMQYNKQVKKNAAERVRRETMN